MVDIFMTCKHIVTHIRTNIRMLSSVAGVELHEVMI